MTILVVPDGYYNILEIQILLAVTTSGFLRLRYFRGFISVPKSVFHSILTIVSSRKSGVKFIRQSIISCHIFIYNFQVSIISYYG